MQKIIIEKPYRFVPPHRGTWWPSFIQRFDLYGLHLKRSEGVKSYEIRYADRLKSSLDAKHGILLAPNHCRASDPLVMGFLAREVGCHLYTMASWHLFNQNWFYAWAIRLMGGFSIYREGVDRKSIATAIESMVEAERPLVIFAEGSTTRTNDVVHPLLDGVGFVARSAAKRRQKAGSGSTVIHPIGIKYLLQGDIDQAVSPVIRELETRLGWPSLKRLPLPDQIQQLCEAFLSLREIYYLRRAFPEIDLSQRTTQLIDAILSPLEKEWLGEASSEPLLRRIKALRGRILPSMITDDLSATERERRWMHLEDIYIAQQISCYLSDYIKSYPSKDRMLETIERLEEDLTDQAKILGDLHAIIEVDHAIEVPVDSRPKGDDDPLMTTLSVRLQAMLDRLSKESQLYAN